jgi:hypothetical protein
MFASKDLFFTRPSGYQISRSVRLRSSASAYFNRTPASASNRKTWTWNGWVKRGVLGAYGIVFQSGYSTTPWFVLQLLNTDNLDVSFTAGVSAGSTTSAVFRDPAAWYMITLAVDTTQSTASNRVKLYVNGVLQTFSTANYPAQNFDTQVNNTLLHTFGGYASLGGYYFDGYLTEINFIDGQALTPSSFGQTNTVTGVWQPIKYTGTYGTNGFYLNFSDNSNNTATTIGKDYSGNGNNWTPNNISVTAGVTYDSMLDVPTSYADGGNGRGNYCVASPISMAGSTATLSNGNLSFTNASASHARRASTIAVSSGKWYAEATITTVGGSYPLVGIATTSTFNGATYVGADSTSYGYASNATKYNNAGAVSYGATYTTNDVIGIALDLDAGTLVFYKNNVSQGTAYSSLSGEFSFAASGLSGTVWELNFGQRPFTYTPPSGYVALNTQNLPTPTISNGANYMAASTYTGTNANLSIVNSGNNAGSISFKPDFVWIKSRSNAYSHNLVDSVRGSHQVLISDLTNAEATSTITTGVTSFNSNGFSLGLDTSTAGSVNGSAQTYVAWQWQAGQGSTSSNTNGSITSTVSVNATAGFSVATYTGNGTAGATVGHGLGVTPSMVIIKSRTGGTSSWLVWFTGFTGLEYILLESTAAKASASSVWNSTAPNSTVVTLGTGSVPNTSTWTYVMYSWAAVAGYSKFGSYTGNGSADGTFSYCGFRPRFVMVKRTDTTGNWFMYDTSRDTYNVAIQELYANLSNAEAAGTTDLDILSNGFKMRATSAGINANAGTYIFAAFAENPFKNSLAR